MKKKKLYPKVIHKEKSIEKNDDAKKKESNEANAHTHIHAYHFVVFFGCHFFLLDKMVKRRF